MRVTLDVLKKFGPKMMEARRGQFLNIEFASITADVSKLDKSRETKCIQSPTIALMIVTAKVLKLDKSRDVRVNPANIALMSVTTDVSKEDTSRDFKESHP